MLTDWPGSPVPSNPLEYLRARRTRMATRAGWFYALPWPVRSLLAGTKQRPCLVSFALRPTPVDERLRKAWRRALLALSKLVANFENSAGAELGTAKPAVPPPPAAEGPGDDGSPVTISNRRLLALPASGVPGAQLTRATGVSARNACRRVAQRVTAGGRRSASRRTLGLPPRGPPPTTLCRAWMSVPIHGLHGQLAVPKGRPPPRVQRVEALDVGARRSRAGNASCVANRATTSRVSHTFETAGPPQASFGSPKTNPPNSSAAALSRSATTCEYTRKVIAGSACPSRPATVRTSMPAAMAWVAAK